MLNNKSVLITGGTGSFGRKMVEVILRYFTPRRLIVYSRDELKQYEMAKVFTRKQYPCMRYLIGDVRDKDRLFRAFNDVDFVIHAAALKHVPIAEYNPFEVIKTNILGSQNVIECAIDQGISKIIGLSTDKATSPVNLYGATKLCADKLFLAGSSYVGSRNCSISVVRYGNVLASRGSVIPLFLEQRASGVLSVTDPRMTRFWITLEEACHFVLFTFSVMTGREIFIPKLPSMALNEMASAIAPGCRIETIGIRPGEKLHEKMIAGDDARRVVEFEDHYRELAITHDRDGYIAAQGGAAVADGFEYCSHTNAWQLSPDELLRIIESLQMAPGGTGATPPLKTRWKIRT